MNREIVPVDGVALAVAQEMSAEDVVRDAAHKASVLKREVLDKQPHPAIINGKRYDGEVTLEALAQAVESVT